MSFIDVLIPLLAGIYLLIFGDKIATASTQSFIQKKGFLKKLGIVLIGVSLIYLAVKLFG